MSINEQSIQQVKEEAQTVLGELYQKIEAAGQLAAAGDPDAVADLFGLRDEVVSLAADFSGVVSSVDDDAITQVGLSS